MKNRILIIFTTILILAITIYINKAPSIYALPTDYSDLKGMVISSTDSNYAQLENYNVEFDFISEDGRLEPSFGTPRDAYGAIYPSAYSGSSNSYYCNNATCTNSEEYWNYIFSISNYWKIYDNGTMVYGVPILFLKPYNYIEPSFEFSCEPKNIMVGETSTCVLKANYHSKINGINFKLNTSDYEIITTEVGNDFENLEINDGIYSLSSKNTLEDSENGKSTTIISFMIKSNKNNITDTDNIKIKDLNYSDELSESPTKALAATVNQSKKNNIIDLKNPKTKNNFIIVSILLSVILLSIVISVIRNKKVSIK